MGWSSWSSFHFQVFSYFLLEFNSWLDRYMFSRKCDIKKSPVYKSDSMSSRLLLSWIHYERKSIEKKNTQNSLQLFLFVENWVILRYCWLITNAHLRKYWLTFKLDFKLNYLYFKKKNIICCYCWLKVQKQ